MNAANQVSILAVQKDGYSGNAYQQVAIDLQEKFTLMEAAYKSLFERHEALQRINAHLIDTMKWIPVEQELPPVDTVVHIAHWITGKGALTRPLHGYHVWFAKNDGTTWKRADGLSADDVFHANVTHWRPLPAPPKAEGGGE